MKRLAAAVGVVVAALGMTAVVSMNDFRADGPISYPAPSSSPSSTPLTSQAPYMATPTTDSLAAISVDCSQFSGSYMTERDHGRTLRLVETSRFGFCLDENKHPFRELITEGCPIGYVSNWSQAGPNNYPIGFEVARSSGTCKIRNRDFWVQIVAVSHEEAHPDG